MDSARPWSQGPRGGRWEARGEAALDGHADRAGGEGGPQVVRGEVSRLGEGGSTYTTRPRIQTSHRGPTFTFSVGVDDIS
eukprot:scaffold32235_cov52-Phaeocystis_antarctica.AAC.2